MVAKIKRKPFCLLRLAGLATEVFDTISLMATEEPDVPEFLRDIVYEADEVWPFPFEMTPEEWAGRLEKARRKVSNH
jgi:hypothetical protein